MTNIIDFTIKNLSLRIKKAEMALEWNTLSLKNESKQSQLDEIKEKIELSNKNLKGYRLAKICLESGGEITQENAEYIMKGLRIRKKILIENLEQCTNVIKQEERALITKEGSTMQTPIGGVTMVHYDDVSISVIKSCKERVEKITKSLELCEKSMQFFKQYTK